MNIEQARKPKKYKTPWSENIKMKIFQRKRDEPANKTIVDTSEALGRNEDRVIEFDPRTLPDPRTLMPERSSPTGRVPKILVREWRASGAKILCPGGCGQRVPCDELVVALHYESASLAPWASWVERIMAHCQKCGDSSIDAFRWIAKPGDWPAV